MLKIQYQKQIDRQTIVMFFYGNKICYALFTEHLFLFKDQDFIVSHSLQNIYPYLH